MKPGRVKVREADDSGQNAPAASMEAQSSSSSQDLKKSLSSSNSRSYSKPLAKPPSESKQDGGYAGQANSQAASKSQPMQQSQMLSSAAVKPGRVKVRDDDDSGRSAPAAPNEQNSLNNSLDLRVSFTSSNLEGNGNPLPPSASKSKPDNGSAGQSKSKSASKPQAMKQMQLALNWKSQGKQATASKHADGQAVQSQSQPNQSQPVDSKREKLDKTCDSNLLKRKQPAMSALDMQMRKAASTTGIVGFLLVRGS